ncbi:MAG: helix-turn-helix transcriptional regulator [Chloroflexi bacterium]|nr:helix-turn-helix transcriptional regulator [Chloroflexota bacterium]
MGYSVLPSIQHAACPANPQGPVRVTPREAIEQETQAHRGTGGRAHPRPAPPGPHHRPPLPGTPRSVPGSSRRPDRGRGPGRHRRQRRCAYRRGHGPKGGRPMKQKRIIYRVRLKAEAVWELLNRLNLTQNELARRIGRSSGYLSQLINGERFPSAETRRRLMRVLGVTDFDVLFVQERIDA